MGMESVFRLSVVMGIVDKLTPKLPGVENGVSGALQNINNGFGAMQKAGVAMTGVGTAILGATAKLVTSTFDTQDALGELASLGVEDLAAVEKAAKSFSDQWAGTSKADFITASYDIKSGIASLSDEGVAKFTELAALTGKATKSTTEEMGSLFATGYGIYKNYYDQMSDIEFGEMFSAGISTAVRMYKTSGSQMAAGISMLGATATNANVSMEEQLAILGQLQTTMSGSEAATKYKAFLNQAASAGEKLGLSFTDANNQLLSTPEILNALKTKYGDTIDAVEKQQLKEAFGTDEAVAMIDLLYNNVDTLNTGIQDLSDSMQQGTAVTKDMAEAINNTPAQKFEVLKQQIHNNAEALGSSLLPTVNNTLDKINDIIGKGAEWISNNQETVDSIMQIVVKVGGFLVVAGTLLTIMGTVGKIMTSGAAAIGTIRKAFSLLSTSFMASPVTLVIIAIVALIAVFRRLYSSSETFRNIWDNISAYLPQVVQMGLQVILNLVQSLVNALPNIISTGTQILLSLIQGISAALPGILTYGTQIIIMLLQGILQNLPQILMSGIQLIFALANGLVNAIPTLMTCVVNILRTIVDTILNTDWIQVGKDIITAIINGITGLVSNLGHAILDGIKSIVSGKEPETAGAEIATKVSDGLQSGSVNVQQTAGNIMNGALSQFNNMDMSSAKNTGMQLINNFGAGLQSGNINIQSLGAGLGTSLSNGIAAGSSSTEQTALQTSQTWSDAGSRMETTWQSMENKFENTFQSIKSTATSYTSSTVSTIQNGFANMEISIPRPKIPKISVEYNTVGSGDATAKVPSYSVSYYAKGGIMTGATAFGIEPGTGRTMVGGEAGPEAILPLDVFWTKLKAFTQEDRKKDDDWKVLKKESSSMWNTTIQKNTSRQERKSVKSKSIHIGKLEIRVDIDKIRDLDYLYKLISEIKDLSEGDDTDPEPEIA